MPSIKFLSAVLCEEVRREASGRAILIGTGMVGPELSAEQETEIPRIAFYTESEIIDVEEIWFRLICPESEDTPIEVDMSLQPMHQIREENSMETPPEGATIAAALVFNNERVKFKGPGVYKLQYKIADEDWHTVREFPFPKADAAN